MDTRTNHRRGRRSAQYYGLGFTEPPESSPSASSSSTNTNARPALRGSYQGLRATPALAHRIAAHNRPRSPPLERLPRPTLPIPRSREFPRHYHLRRPRDPPGDPARYTQVQQAGPARDPMYTSVEWLVRVAHSVFSLPCPAVAVALVRSRPSDLTAENVVVAALTRPGHVILYVSDINLTLDQQRPAMQSLNTSIMVGDDLARYPYCGEYLGRFAYAYDRDSLIQFLESLG